MSKVLRFSSQTALREHMRMHPGGTFHVLVEHDDVCTLSACRCVPTYVLRPLSAETLSEGQRLEAQWLKDTSS